MSALTFTTPGAVFENIMLLSAKCDLFQFVKIGSCQLLREKHNNLGHISFSSKIADKTLFQEEHAI